MKPVIRSWMSLFVACAAAFAGGLALLIANGEHILEGARLASANAAPTSIMPASEWNDLDFLLCHTPTKAVGAVTRGMIRVAAAQTEAPQAKTNAASPALAFADAGRSGGACLRRNAEGADARRQGKPTRAGADYGLVGAIR